MHLGKGIAAAGLVVACSVVAPPSTAAEFPLVPFGCGDTVTRSVRVDGDVGSPGTPCATHGLIAGTKGITIDLNGNTIWGNGVNDIVESESGVFIEDRSGVRVTNGAVRGFERGVLSANIVGGTRIDRVVAAHNVQGIDVEEPKGTVVTGNVVVYSGDDGIAADSAGATITNNVSANNVEDGIFAPGGRATISGNRVSDNLEHGIRAGDNAVISGNTVADHATGIRADANAQVARNTVVITSDNGIELNGANARAGRNTVVDATLDGILAEGADSVVSSNRVVGSGAHGIEADQSGFTIRRNTVVASGDTGIETHGDGRILANRVTAGSLDGIVADTFTEIEISDNTAIGNGSLGSDVYGIRVQGPGIVTGDDNRSIVNAQQCQGVSCRGVPVPADLPMSSPGCGAAVTRSIRLGADVGSAMSGCSGHGLRITAPDVVLDLNGHTIWGDDDTFGTDDGIEVTANGARILNGTVRGFDDGVDTEDASDVTIAGVFSAFHADKGFNLRGTNRSGRRVVASTVVGISNGGVDTGSVPGIRLTDVISKGGTGPSFSIGGGTVVRAVARGGGPSSIGLAGAGGSLTDSVAGDNQTSGFGIGKGVIAERNIAYDNGMLIPGTGGFVVSGPDAVLRRNMSAGNLIGVLATGPRIRAIGNTVAGNTEDGFRVLADGATLEGNLALANDQLGINVIGAGARLKANRTFANADDGIEVDGSAAVRDGRSHGNGTRGIHLVAGTTGRVVDNRAFGNGFETVNQSGEGIRAVDATGSGNLSYGNDDPDACDPDELCVG